MNEFDPNQMNMTHAEACTETKVDMLSDLGSFALALDAIKKGTENNDSAD